MRQGDLFHHRYKLLRKLGQGGFSTVWLIEDIKSGIQQALKVFIKQDEEGIQLCKQEYTKTHALRHANILTPTYFDVYDEQPYLLMPYLSGGSLQERIGKLSWEELMQLVYQIGNALHYLHNQETPVYHNDLKPDNILIDHKGHFVLTDFGISSQLKHKLTHTLRSTQEPISGETPMAYKAPELFHFNDWKKQDVSAKSDIWSFGVTLYYSYFGLLPFNGEGGLGQLIYSNSTQHDLMDILTFSIEGKLSDKKVALLQALTLALPLEPSARCSSLRLISELQKQEIAADEENNMSQKLLRPLDSLTSRPIPRLAKQPLWLLPLLSLFFFALLVLFSTKKKVGPDGALAPGVTKTIELLDSTITLDTLTQRDDLSSVESMDELTEEVDNQQKADTKEPESSYMPPVSTRPSPLQEPKSKEQSQTTTKNTNSSQTESSKEESPELRISTKHHEPQLDTASKQAVPISPREEHNASKSKATKPETPPTTKMAWVTYNLEVPLALSVDLTQESSLSKYQTVEFETIVDITAQGQTIISKGTKAYGLIKKITRKKITIEIKSVKTSGGDDVKLYKNTYELGATEKYYARKNKIFFAYTNERKQVRIR